MAWSTRQIAEMGDADEHPEEALRKLDVELAATIERLQQVRVELAGILEQSTPTDLPADFAPATTRSDLSAADRSFLVVASRVLGAEGLKSYAEMLQSHENGPEMTAFDDLSPEYSPAQLDVMQRVAVIRAEQARSTDDSAPRERSDSA